MAAKLIDLVRDNFADAVVGSHELAGSAVVMVARERLLDVMRWLRDDAQAQMNMLAMVTAVDYYDYPSHLRSACTPVDRGNAAGVRVDALPRFEVVYELLSLPLRHRLRVKTLAPEEDPTVPSLVSLWHAANWGEREVWDMYGIRFAGHPDLRRILMYEEFEGHPLRRDYDQRGYQPLIDMPHLAEYADHAKFR